jgi:glycosyltransferase involved in cell wall biosynthesis
MTLFYKLFDAFLPIGTRNHAFYVAHQVPERKLFLVPYAIDNNFFSSESSLSVEDKEKLRYKFGLPSGKPIILYVSKLQTRKHPHRLLQAYKALRDNDLDASLVFVGSGDRKNALIIAIERDDIPDVYFMGFRNQKDLPLLYSISDIFVLPSENEPWGLVINEAMAAGLPILASEEIGAVPDLVKNACNGFTFPANDIKQLTEQLKLLIRDRQLRISMGLKSREIISTWDYEKGVKGIRAAMAHTLNSGMN